MNVVLLNRDAISIDNIYKAYRQCYSDKEAYNIALPSTEKVDEFITTCVKRGHLSPLEHVSFTFSISGVSRALTHQLVRHRIASYSQQSQRYVNMSNFTYVVPPSIQNNTQVYEEYKEFMEYIKKFYDKMFYKSINIEDIRYILPNATCTSIVVTMNCRELINFFAERLCTKAQWEIRSLASKMYAICCETLPQIFTNFGAKCINSGRCTEDNSCGLLTKISKN